MAKYKVKQNTVTGSWELWHGIYLSSHVDAPAAWRQMRWHAMWTRPIVNLPVTGIVYDRLPKHWWQRYVGKHRRRRGPVNVWDDK